MLMSKEEIEFTINRMKDDNDNNLRDGYDRVIERMCNYIEANMDDFMECYDEEETQSKGNHVLAMVE